MSDPADLLLSSYDFHLPEARIAQRPLEPRHSARLLVVDPAGMGEPPWARHRSVWDLQEQLQAGDLLVVNDTRVLRARLEARRPTGGAVELLVLEPWQPPAAAEALVAAGPPCSHEHDSSDNDRYQTTYAARPGAVAAPTAGLHLSDELLAAIRARGVAIATTTLHVGLGTFRPVETEDLSSLQLHSEWVEVTPELVEAVEACRARRGRVIAIGTTSVRSLEAVAQLHGGVLRAHTGPVNLVIQPGYRFAVVQGLLTNFHLPRSSLLLLVSALIGRERLLALYAEAIEHRYRFFSYGDAMWIAPEAVLRSAAPGSGSWTPAH